MPALRRTVAMLGVVLALGCCLILGRPGQAQEKSPVEAKPGGNAPPASAEARLREQFDLLVASPTKENYLAAHKLLVACDKYSPYSTDLGDAAQAANTQQPEEARAKLRQAGINVLLSPRAHMLAARLATAAGDPSAAKKEAAAAKSCLAGIMATGDGSAKKPYLVSRVEDEYDVLSSAGKRSTRQGLRMDQGKSYDVIFTSDGGEVHFDVSDVFGSLQRRH
ncbi:MAG: hypothetical protein ABSG86_20240 [Thermoguttaceae bacterium]|jgi:hypothetical protein